MYDPIKMQYSWYENRQKKIIQLTHVENLLFYCLYNNKGENMSINELSIFMYSTELTPKIYTKITSAKSSLLKKLKGHIKIITYNKNGYTLIEGE